MKCIVLEDDPFWMSEVSDVLSAQGVEVLPATSGAQALQLLDQNPEAAMVIDIILPDQDGIEVLREARVRRPNLRVLAISGGGRLGPAFYLRLADAFGATAVIEKPFTAGQLVSAWNTAVGVTAP